MNATNQDHPDRSDLLAFGLGRLDPARSAAVEKHVAGCDSCCEALQKAPDDTLVNKLREAATCRLPRQRRPQSPHVRSRKLSATRRRSAEPVEAPADSGAARRATGC